MKPLVVVNFKAYKEGLEEGGLELVGMLSKYSNVIMSVPAPIIGIVAGYSLQYDRCIRYAKVFAQHVDPDEPGAHTGSITVEEIKMAGAEGSLLNHSEKRIPLDVIEKTVKRLRENGLKSIVCCQTIDEAVEISKFSPDYIAYEPPELIGGNVSVSNAKPEVVKEIVDKVAPIPVLVGAGVKNREDVRKSVELGAVGVLVASGIIKAKDREKAVKEIVEW